MKNNALNASDQQNQSLTVLDPPLRLRKPERG